MTTEVILSPSPELVPAPIFAPTPKAPGLRDRALIGVMVYTFARINAALEMKVKDYYVQGRRGWVHLHEKGGEEHTVPCHHNLER